MMIYENASKYLRRNPLCRYQTVSKEDLLILPEKQTRPPLEEDDRPL
jgi:hypothetical protein